MIDTRVPEQHPDLVWAYDDCAFVVEGTGARVRCLSHTGDAWEAAEALGGVPPCAELVDAMRRALLNNNTYVPGALAPMMAYMRWMIPDSMIDQQGKVLQAFFDEEAPAVSADDLRTWGAQNSQSDIKAVAWLQERGIDPDPWVQLGVSTVRVARLVRAGISAQQFSACRQAMPFPTPPSRGTELVHAFFQNLAISDIRILVDATPQVLGGFARRGLWFPSRNRWAAKSELHEFAQAIALGLTAEIYEKTTSAAEPQSINRPALRTWINWKKHNPDS